METSNLTPRFWNAVPLIFLLLIFMVIGMTTCQGQSGIFAETRIGMSVKFHDDFGDDYPMVAHEYGLGIYSKNKDVTIRSSIHLQNQSTQDEQYYSVFNAIYAGSKTTFEFHELFVSLGAYSLLSSSDNSEWINKPSSDRIELSYGYRHSFGKIKIDLQYGQALTKIYEKANYIDQGKMNTLTIGIIHEL